MRAIGLRWTSTSIAFAVLLVVTRAQAEAPPDPVYRGPVASRIWWYGPRETADDRYLSGDESGSPYRLRRPAQGLLWIPRLVLFVPQTLLVLVTQPLRLALILEDRHKIVERARRFFFNDAETFGVFPTLFFETGFGASVGLRLLHRDLLGRGEHLAMRGGFGGVDRQVYELSFDTGRRFAPFRIETNAGYEATNRRRFYTLGNVDEVDEADVAGSLDARSADVAVRTRYVAHDLRATAGANVRLSRRFELSASERIRHRTFSIGGDPEDEPPWITDVYAEQTLIGFEDQTDLYTEVRASFRDTRSFGVLAKEDLPTHGGRIDLWGAVQHGIGSSFRFGRAGFDAQSWIHLFGGNRTLRLRLRAASVIGEAGRIPLVDHPALGGWLLLRGYPRERFRDQIAAVATAEYRFPLVYQTAAYVFVDSGRVYRRVSDLGFEDLRVGYGGGFIVLSRSHFLASVQIASSIDGGVYAYLNLDTTDALGDID